MHHLTKYFEANSGNADRVESRLKEMNADYMIMESDISRVRLRRDGLTPIWNSLFFQSFLWVN